MTDASRLPRPTPFSSTDDKLWATIAHFGGLVWFVPSLVVYLRTRARPTLSRQEAKEAKEALNWQITFTMFYVVVVTAEAVLAAILLLTPVGSVLPALGLLPILLYAGNVMLSIRGGLRVNTGGSYRYPFSIRLIR